MDLGTGLTPSSLCTRVHPQEAFARPQAGEWHREVTPCAKNSRESLPGQAVHALLMDTSLQGLNHSSWIISTFCSVLDAAQECSGSPDHCVRKPQELGRSRQRVMLSQPQTLYLSAKTWEELLHRAGQGNRETTGGEAGEARGTLTTEP